jgi:hypothetical protein
MIIKLGIVRDGHIVETKFFSSHQHVILPIFTADELALLEKAHASRRPSDPYPMVPSVPAFMRTGNLRAEFELWLPKDIATYAASLPIENNPFAARVPRGTLIGSDIALNVKKDH